MDYYSYGEKEINYLKSKDQKLGAVIDKIDHIHREVMPDLFTALVRVIVDQQISAKAAETIWQRILTKFEEITPQKLSEADPKEIQTVGLTMKKAVNIHKTAEKVLSRELDLEALQYKTDEEIYRELSKLNGIGLWTAEMFMIFSMQRPNIISYGDLAIHRGLRMLYNHRKIDKKLFEKYKRRYTPYATVASLYLWA
ncbi:MAG: DNA-3-methyladenine glycosylase 2 family protein, partial [Clostridia bacterium]|nr:DNA-3-methyladenine glycosylase 2 family protein [Clostridia bacterium]